jgi:hypothetical protein
MRKSIEILLSFSFMMLVCSCVSKPYLVQIIIEGDEFREDRVEITGVDRKKVVVNLKRVVREGELIVRTEPSEAMIYLDGKSVGKGSYDGKGLSPKSYRIKVTQDGYEVWERDIGVEVGKRVEVLAILKEKGREIISTPVPPKPGAPKKEEAKLPEVLKVPPRVDWSKKSFEAPDWRVGDQWTYKNVKGITWVTEVVDLDKKFLSLKDGEVGATGVYDRGTMECKFLIKDGRKSLNQGDRFKKIFDFPISVGRGWSYTTEERLSTTGSMRAASERYFRISSKFEVDGVEEVKTAAGVFMAYKIYFTQKTSEAEFGPKNQGWVRLWYSPEVRTWVKREVEKSSFWDNVPWFQDAELTSFTLK